MTGAPAPRRRPLRLREYDYTLPGAHFVTICTGNRRQFFDDPAVRAIAEECWREIPQHYASAELDEWIVMPNHVHGILWIVGKEGVPLNAPTVGKTTHCPLQADRLSAISPGRETLGVLIRTSKSAVTMLCRRSGHSQFAWQRGYYEHVIRDEAGLHNVRQYIINNPLDWATDPDNPAVAHVVGKKA